MSGLRIGVEAWGLSGPLLHTGMGQCAALLLRSLPEVDPACRVTAYGAPREERPAWLPDEVDWRPVGSGTSRLAAIRSRLVDLPRVAKRERLDVVHVPAVHVRPSLPPIPTTPCPLVVTIHDAIPISYYGRGLPTRLRAFYRWNVARALRADALLTGSHAAAREIAGATGCDGSRLRIVPPGIDFASNGSREPLDRLGLDRPYVLFAGSFEPRKNLAGAIRAFAAAADCARFDLVALVEARSGHAVGVSSLPRELGVAERVRFVHSLPDADLRALTTHALALLFPSFAEGFGMPPLQAAACGVPVVASDLPVLREVLGDGAVFVDPASTSEIALAIDAITEDEGLRGRVIAAGHERVATFTPRRWAEDHLAIYERAVAGASHRETVP
jgi:glycosyltransferase involved in cell wall biosynthesis